MFFFSPFLSGYNFWYYLQKNTGEKKKSLEYIKKIKYWFHKRKSYKLKSDTNAWTHKSLNFMTFGSF